MFMSGMMDNVGSPALGSTFICLFPAAQNYPSEECLVCAAVTGAVTLWSSLCSSGLALGTALLLPHPSSQQEPQMDLIDSSSPSWASQTAGGGSWKSCSWALKGNY